MDLVLVEITQKKLLYQSQSIKNRKLLAYLAHSQQALGSIDCIYNMQRTLYPGQSNIADPFVKFYSDLYFSRVHYGEKEYYVYYTPAHLHKMGRVDTPEGPQCRAAVGNYFHMIWLCGKNLGSNHNISAGKISLSKYLLSS